MCGEILQWRSDLNAVNTSITQMNTFKEYISKKDTFGLTRMVLVYDIKDDLNVLPVSKQSLSQVWGDLKCIKSCC